MNAGLIGGILGVTIGIIGGLIGTYASIKNTNGPKEKAFMIKAAIVFWIASMVFLLSLILLPKPYNFLPWIVYLIALPMAIIYINKKQREIQEKKKKE